MAPKHTTESDDGSYTSTKRQKMSQHTILTEKILETATALIEFIPTIRQDIEQNHQANSQYLKTVLMNWNIACNLAKGPLPWTKRDIQLLDEQLPDDDAFQSYNAKYNLFSTLQKAKLCGLPSSSDFGKNWSQYISAFEDRLLCCRPPDSRGLPLRILHHVFRRYHINVQNPLPQASETAAAAVNAAKHLCASMGNSFSTKSDSSSVNWDYKADARVRKFDECVRGILQQYDKSVILKATTDLSSGIVDGALLVKDVPFSLREMKGEPGSSGDPYMQVVRSYDLAAKVQRELQTPMSRAFVAQGAPMFLLCVSGPSLMVAGGFCDGDQVIVEPLGDPNIMLKDYTDERRDKLARVLYALAMGIDELKKSMNQGFPSALTPFPPFTPRIYGSCNLYESALSARLVFTAKFESPDSNRLLFTGSLIKASAEPIPVLVKLVNGRYGVDVHHLLAIYNLAPTLHAYSESEGAPRAYVMEYLDPSSWKPLSDVSAHADAATSILLSIDKVIKILQKNGMVHGDLRSPNIMVKVSPAGEIVLEEDEGKMRANIKVIDFDWAGVAGHVFYPLSRNPDIAGSWPGKPGGTINKDHDRELFHSWWSNLTAAWSG